MTSHLSRRLSALIVRLGALVAVSAVAGLVAAPARADFGFSQFGAGFGASPAAPPYTQAGGHGDLFVDLALNQVTEPVSGQPITDEQVRDLQVDLPAGFYGNPQAVATCDQQELITNIWCNPDAQVGYVDLQLAPDPNAPFFGSFKWPVYNMSAPDGKTAVLGFAPFKVLVLMEVSVRSDGDYGLRTTLRNISQGLPLYAAHMRLWGVPADSSHDADRTTVFGGPPTPSGLQPRPFLTLPARCEPVNITARARSWQHPDQWVTESRTTPSLTGCDALRFAPKIHARPASTKADSPSGFDVDVRVPQESSSTGVATPQLEKAVVTLPEGMVISPSSAQGLRGCSDEQLAPGTNAEPTCPDASKIGTVSIDTPLLPDPLEGDIVLGSPKPGQLFRLWLVARGSGILLKLPGVAQPDPKTGQLTTTFDNTPQLPFSNLHLHFKGGARAPLATPQTCGTKTTAAVLTPWTGPTATPSDSFDITGCTGGFTPTFEAGTTNPEAGAFSPFTMTIRRADGDQEISTIAADLPPGLLGILTGIPQCPEAAAAAGTCDVSTQLGTTTVESGSGDQPLPLTGKVFLAGPYKGQPYSLSIVVRAVAGPFDLGTVVVRVPLNIDASRGKVSVTSDPLPTILEGVPLRLKTINVTLDRPGFMFNATNCTPMAVGATLTSVGGAVATPSSRYQALGCGDLPLKPSLKVRLTGRKEMGRNGNPGVVADLAQTPGQAGLKQVDVPLPAGVSVDTANTSLACPAADATARKCPASSIVGRASVKTPALPGELTGPVYFVQGQKTDPKTGRVSATLPRLWLKLATGGVPLDLWADTALVGGRVVTTFTGIPDAPIASFHLEIDGGDKGILKSSVAQCPAARTSGTVFAGQNGRVLRRTLRWGADCATRIAKTRATRSGVTLTVQGVGAGRLTASGSGVRRASKSIKSADVASITAKLTAAAQRTLARDGRVRVRLAVTFTPKSGKATTLRKAVTIR